MMNINAEMKEIDKGSRISIEKLKKIVFELLVANQLPIEQAEVVADCFVEADAYGVSTHGVSVLPTHLDKLRSGSYNITPSLDIIKEGGAFAVIDADNAIGAVSASFSMKYAVKKCKQTGIFTVFSRNSNTYGPAFYYPLLAAQSNLIGITFCNSPAAMPAWNGREKLLGTNPFSVVIPCKNKGPIIFDIATSKVAKSKINEARIRNEQIPDGWALDANGNPTTDPIEAIKGLMLPMEGHKGYGLALTIDVLSGVLSGAAFLNGVGKFYSEDNKCMNVGQTFIAIDPRQVFGEDFYALMDEYSNTIYNSKEIEGKKIRIPGDSKFASKKDSIINGIKLDLEILNRLDYCLESSGLSYMKFRTE